jgi:hypothetical protein
MLHDPKHLAPQKDPSSGPPPASLGRAAGWHSAFHHRARPSSLARPPPAPDETGRYAFWGRVLLLRRQLQGTNDARVGDPPSSGPRSFRTREFSVRNPHPLRRDGANAAWRAERTPDGRRVPRERRTRVGARVEVESLALVRVHRAPLRRRRPRLGVGAPLASADDQALLIDRDTPREKRGMPGTRARVLSAGETRFFRAAHAPP